VIIFNVPGISMVALGISIAFGIGMILGTSAEGPLMLISGPLVAIFDLAYRSTRPQPRWFHPGFGGSLFYLPVWLFGVIWTVLGAIYTLRAA